jgi:methionyl aminopeptidase
MTFVDAKQATRRRPGEIKLFGAEAFASMRKAGQLTAEALDLMVDLVKPGVTTDFLDRTVFEFAMDHHAYPAPLNYRGFTRGICTSINHVVCHGIPNDKPLREGDIVNIDITLVVDGWHGDASRMYGVGTIPRRAERLIDVTYESLLRGIAAVKPGARRAISVKPFKPMLKANAARLCAISVVMDWDNCSMMNPIFCIMAAKAMAYR